MNARRKHDEAEEPRAAEERLDEEAIARGRAATRPKEIPKKGWRDIVIRVKRAIAADNISIVAAGVAFFGLFAVVPALAALVSIFGLVADPADVQQLVASMRGAIPEEAASLLNEQLTALANRPQGALSFGLIVSILLALWSASKGIKAMMAALNIAYEEEEQRGFFRLNAVALVLTIGAILAAAIALALVVIAPAIFEAVGLERVTEIVIAALRWPFLAVAMMAGLAVLYRFGPSRQRAEWRWVTWGSVGAVVIWLVVSALFSFYVSNFGSYSKTYGSLGAVVILLMWFYLSAFAVLLGAELNSEMEHQTAKDTTTGEPAPLGERGARMADTIGDTP